MIINTRLKAAEQALGVTGDGSPEYYYLEEDSQGNWYSVEDGNRRLLSAEDLAVIEGSGKYVVRLAYDPDHPEGI